MSDDWKKEMERFTNDQKELRLLREGPKSLTDAWHLQAIKYKWKKIYGKD